MPGFRASVLRALQAPGAPITVLHALLAALGALETIRMLHQPWMRVAIPEEPARIAFLVVLPVASAAASWLAIWSGARTARQLAVALFDLGGIAAYVLCALLLNLESGPDTRAVVGVMYVALLGLRLAPTLLPLVAGHRRSPAAAFLVSLVAYAALALWAGASAAAQGDQPHYLLAADRLARGSLDLGPAYADDTLFARLTGGLRFEAGDLETHVARTPAGDRLVQGYGLALLVAPGWAAWGKEGALLVLAFIGALASLGTYLLVHETVANRRAAAAAWAMTAFLAPLPSFVGTVYPNVVGAAAIVWAYRLLFTAPRRRPLIAGLLAGVTLFLTPRDGATVLLLLPFAVLAGRAAAVRFGAAFAAAVLAATAFDMWAYGVAAPYAGYGFGIEMAQKLDSLPTLSFQVWTGLPGLLFDRAFGLAGSAPWVFLGLAGLGAALAGTRAALRARSAEALSPAARTLGPAVVAVVGSVVALSVYRLWQGGWSPPNRYIVDVVPLWAPLVALGLAALGGPAARWVVRPVVALSALATFLLVAVPNLGYNLSHTSRLSEALEAVAPVSPLSWLPSFQAPDPAALAVAWLQSVPLWVACGLLVRAGLAPLRLPAFGAAVRARRRAELALFVCANLLAVAATALWPVDPGRAALDPQLAASLLTRWVPFALIGATALTTGLAWSQADRGPLFRRHALLLLTVPASGALVHFADAAAPALLAAPLVLLVFGIAVHGLAALWESRAVRSDRAIGALLGLTVLAASLGLLAYDRTVQLGRSDEPHYLLIMQSMVRDRDLELTNDYDGAYEDLYAGRLPDRHIVQVGNAQRPIRDLGLPLLGALPFALARRTGVLVLMCVLGAVFAWRSYALLRSLAFGRDAALLAAGSTALLHPLFTYTTQVYPDLPAALAVLLAAEAVAAPLSPRRVAFASALCGALAWLTLRADFIGVGMGLVLLVQALRARRLALVLAAIIPGALVVAAYAAVGGTMFGIWLPSAGYVVIREQQVVVAYTPWIGIPGLLFDRTFGLLSHAPLAALAAVGLVPLWHRARALGSVALAALAAGWLLEVAYIGMVQYWWADGSPSSRYLLASLPLLLCAAAEGFARLRGALAWGLVLAAAAWGAGVTFVLALLPGLRYDLAADVAPTGGPGALWEQLTAVLRADPALLFPSLVRAAPIDAALALCWLVLLAALVLLGARRRPAEAIAAR